MRDRVRTLKEIPDSPGVGILCTFDVDYVTENNGSTIVNNDMRDPIIVT